MQRTSAIVTFCLLCALPGCATFPELDAAVPRAELAGTPPALVPLAPLVAQAQASGRVDPAEVAQDISARIANLRARAARLAGPVIEPAIRARMIRSFR